MLHGLGRDAWSYFDQTHVALLNATSRKERTTHQSRLRADEVVIMAPIFLNQQDPGCYPVDANKQPNSTALVWNDSDWAEGADSIYPATVNDAQGIPFAAPGCHRSKLSIWPWDDSPTRRSSLTSTRSSSQGTVWARRWYRGMH